MCVTFAVVYRSLSKHSKVKTNLIKITVVYFTPISIQQKFLCILSCVQSLATRKFKNSHILTSLYVETGRDVMSYRKKKKKNQLGTSLLPLFNSHNTHNQWAGPVNRLHLNIQPAKIRENSLVVTPNA